MPVTASDAGSMPRAVERLHVIAQRGSGSQLAHRRHLDQHRGDLEQRVGLRIEAAGLDVDHDRQEAAEAVGDARCAGTPVHAATSRQASVLTGAQRHELVPSPNA